jgi:hypothetical protein
MPYTEAKILEGKERYASATEALRETKRDLAEAEAKLVELREALEERDTADQALIDHDNSRERHDEMHDADRVRFVAAANYAAERLHAALASTSDALPRLRARVVEELAKEAQQEADDLLNEGADDDAEHPGIAAAWLRSHALADEVSRTKEPPA